jgi:hypothetical protein
MDIYNVNKQHQTCAALGANFKFRFIFRIFIALSNPKLMVLIQINQPTRCNNFSSLLLDVYLQINMFQVSSRPSSGAQQLHQQPLVLPSERGDSSAVSRAARPRYRRAPKVNPEAAAAAVELLMMGVRTPETC